jgi:hypothetical protein
MAAANNTKSIAPAVVSPVLRYGLAVLSIAAALGLAEIFIYFHLPQPFAVFALSAIAITFWYGGTKPGVLATLFACIIRYVIDPGAGAVPVILYDVSFVMFALLMSMVTRARDNLELKIGDRTADLIRANEELRLEISERKQAEYLIG